MKLVLLQEPELEFGAGRHVDIRFGLKNYGPVTFELDTSPKEIQVGFVGTSKTIHGVREWMERSQSGVPAKASNKPNFFPAFPGFGKESCFKCGWITGERLQRDISARELSLLIANLNKADGVRKAVELIVAECRYLTETTNVDVVIVAPPVELINHLDVNVSIESDEGTQNAKSEDDAEENGTPTQLDLHDMLKAHSLTTKKPIQYIRPSTYDENVKEVSGVGKRRQLQDAATRAWNFYTALYYKAGGTPWRLRRHVSDLETCFVGISFYRSLDKKSVNTSVAQIFNERGEGMILRGGEAKISKEDRQPHLSETDMHTLLISALKEFDREHRHTPARVVLHKTSGFNDAELKGCNAAIDEMRIKGRDILVIRESSVRLFRSGQYPPLRGTFLELDGRRGLLYTRGSTPFFQMYPGMYVPRALEIDAVDTETPARTLAQEILALTKMNWNNTQFDSALPITLRAARQVGAILKYAGDIPQITSSYAYYM